MRTPERTSRPGVGRKVLLALLFIILAATFVFGKRGLVQWQKLREQCQIMQAQNDSLQKTIEILTTRIQALEAADSLELERAARYWGMVRPGEEIYIIRDPQDSLHNTPH